MSSLLRKPASKPAPMVKTPEKVTETKPEEKIPPKVTECYGCGEVFTAEDLTFYKQHWYCQPCLTQKKADAKASKPAGLTEDIVKAIITDMLPNLDNYFTRPEILEKIDVIVTRVDALSAITASNAADLKNLKNNNLPATFAGDLQVLLDKVKSSLGPTKLAGDGAVVNAYRRMCKFLEGKSA